MKLPLALFATLTLANTLNHPTTLTAPTTTPPKTTTLTALPKTVTIHAIFASTAQPPTPLQYNRLDALADIFTPPQHTPIHKREPQDETLRLTSQILYILSLSFVAAVILGGLYAKCTSAKKVLQAEQAAAMSDSERWHERRKKDREERGKGENEEKRVGEGGE